MALFSAGLRILAVKNLLDHLDGVSFSESALEAGSKKAVDKRDFCPRHTKKRPRTRARRD